MLEIFIKDEIYSLLNKAPEYSLQEGYFKDTSYVYKGRLRHSYSVTKKAYNELKEIAERRISRRKFKEELISQKKRILSTKEPTLLTLLQR